MRADFHMHTTASDGSMSPTDLMTAAKEVGLNAVAVTDHDSVGGVREAHEEARRLGMDFVPGIEFNTVLGTEDVHVLAYWIDISGSVLDGFLTRRREERVDRVVKIIELLRDRCSIDLSLGEVRMDSDDQALTRLHVARALVAKGYGKSSDEVFSRYMAKGKPAYVRQDSMTPSEAVELTRRLGGVSVLAHPVDLQNPFEVLQNLIDAGLGGVEVYYPDQNNQMRAQLIDVAHHHDLMMTGGSDFHGTGSRHTCPIGGMDIPPDVISGLLNWGIRRQSSTGAET